MTVPHCVHAPDGRPKHGANEWHIIVVTVTITVTVLVCAGVSPDWIAATAALLTAFTRR
ncbi:hypothetical protein ACFWZ2_40000 [Streptomyces sp. NPDC059002]|uniref:hypothetical protein n=1 Tax=Streptomyces sp. NPDC059002 TaxID=3346690 RepID=UPI0036996803